MPIFLNPDEYAQPHDRVLTGPLQQVIAARLAAQPILEGTEALHPVAVAPPQGEWVNEAAQNYARQRLAQAARAGLLRPSTMMLNGDPAAQWRAVSAQIAQVAAQHGYRDAGAWLDHGAPGHNPATQHVRHGGHNLIQHLAARRSGQWVRA